MSTAAVYVVGFLGMVALIIGISFVFSWPVYFLWNESLVDAVTFAKPITWIQAWGLSVLCGILIKSTSSSKD